MLDFNLEILNKELSARSPQEIIHWAVSLSHKRIVTTSFGTYSGVLLKSVTKVDRDIPVIWCDTGYNNSETYKHAELLTEKLSLNLKVYAPKYTKAYIDHHVGLPTADDPRHKEFSEIVKLEPFRRALNEWKPEVWFTNIRTDQTRLRDSKNILSYSQEGILKVSPFYYYKDEEIEKILKNFGLPKNKSYFDPVKALQSRECGIHKI
jgi:phosphoadenosine phosphosulfate reductase